MWYKIVARKDDRNWLTRTVEKSVVQKVVDQLNELERTTGGKITLIEKLADKENEYAELVVSIDDTPTSAGL